MHKHRPSIINILLQPLFYSVANLVLLALIANPASAGEFEFATQGYLRAGHGISSGTTQQCFSAPGAGAKYRFGNECDNYFDLGAYIQYNFGGSDDHDSAPYLRLDTQFEFGGSYDREIKWLATSQLYIELGNFSKLTGEAKLWVGRRYFERQDIHINDYFLLNHKGDGAGIKDLPVGVGSFAYTYLQNRIYPQITGTQVNNKIKQSMHEMRWYHIPVNEGGELLLYAMFSRIHGNLIAANTHIQSVIGWGAGAVHTQKAFFDGDNRFSVQYGRGSAIGAASPLFQSGGTIGALTSGAAATDLKNSQTIRVTEQHVIDSDNWAWMSALIYERKMHSRFSATDQTWISAGVRPVYYLNNNWRLVSEVGHDYVKKP